MCDGSELPDCLGEAGCTRFAEFARFGGESERVGICFEFLFRYEFEHCRVNILLASSGVPFPQRCGRILFFTPLRAVPNACTC